MSDKEEFAEVQICAATYGEEDGESEGKWMMMSYKKDGLQCITFAVREYDEIWMPGPFPAHLTECEDCLEGLAADLAEQGYTLTHVPEQMTRVS